MINDYEGEQLVKIAREAVETYIRRAMVPVKDDRIVFSDKMGVFVTLNHLNEKGEEHLRGCIGFPLPEKGLYQSVVEAAIGAATIDPRFSPLVESELSRIIFELSFLTPPQLIQVVHPTDYYDHIKIGRDGLILRWEKGSALLLPQVAKRFGWDVDEFLLNLCYKGGITPDAWVLPESKLYKFQAQVYIESEPKGRVIRLQ
ncbi:MAG: TIGR00296 family protein [Nitrososphaeraceae archaeon]|jgi:uncharacterized protein (TIGR00296 family)